MKRVFKEGILSLLAVVTGVSLVKSVNAQASSPDYYVSVFLNWIVSTYGVFFAALFNVNVLDEFLFAKILLFIIIFAVAFMALKKVPVFEEKRPILFLVTLCVSILAVRYLVVDSDFFRAILLPYGVLGAAITVFLPFLIFFMFVHTSGMGSFGRRAAWFVYASIFLVMWGYSEYMASGNWIYYLGLGFVILSFIFDKNIHSYFQFGDFKKARRGMLRRRRLDLQTQLRQAIDLGNTRDAERITKELNSLVRKLGD